MQGGGLRAVGSRIDFKFVLGFRPRAWARGLGSGVRARVQGCWKRSVRLLESFRVRVLEPCTSPEC